MRRGEAFLQYSKSFAIGCSENAIAAASSGDGSADVADGVVGV